MGDHQWHSKIAARGGGGVGEVGVGLWQHQQSGKQQCAWQPGYPAEQPSRHTMVVSVALLGTLAAMNTFVSTAVVDVKGTLGAPALPFGAPKHLHAAEVTPVLCILQLGPCLVLLASGQGLTRCQEMRRWRILALPHLPPAPNPTPHYAGLLKQHSTLVCPPAW